MRPLPPITTRRAHTKRVCEWNAQVRHDHGVRHAAFRVASEIADHVNCETNEAWPSQKRLAERTGMSEGHVNASVRNLTDRGHLDVTPGKPGRGHSNRYRLILKGQPGEAFARAKPQMADASNDNKPQPSEAFGRGNLCANRENLSGVHSKPQPADMNLLKEPKEEPSKKNDETGLKKEVKQEPPQNEERFERDFEVVWNSYPRKENWLASKEAFRRALKKTTAQQILDGARRYRDARAGEDHRFTKSLPKWLDEERWRDQPVQKRGSFV